MKNLKILYWCLIITFAILYVFIAISSTLHVIEFFNLANTLSLSILLAIAYETAQSTILFSLLMTDNNKKLLPWLLMIVVTCIQITGNVYANFKYLDVHSSETYLYFKRAILFWYEGENQEMYKVLIAWIEGSILPLIALGLTALVANQINLIKDSVNNKEEHEQSKINDSKINDSKSYDELIDKIANYKYADEKSSIKENKENTPIVDKLLNTAVELGIKETPFKEDNIIEDAIINTDEVVPITTDVVGRSLEPEIEVKEPVVEDKIINSDRVEEIIKNEVNRQVNELKNKPSVEELEENTDLFDLQESLMEQPDNLIKEDEIIPEVINEIVKEPDKPIKPDKVKKEKTSKIKKAKGRLKKEQSLVVPQKEAAPKKRKGRITKKDKENIQLIDELRKPSKGEEVINQINKNDTLVEQKESEESDPKQSRNNVEVISVTPTFKDKKEKLEIDKFGIPIPAKRANWDKI